MAVSNAERNMFRLRPTEQYARKEMYVTVNNVIVAVPQNPTEAISE